MQQIDWVARILDHLSQAPVAVCMHERSQGLLKHHNAVAPSTSSSGIKPTGTMPALGLDA